MIRSRAPVFLGLLFVSIVRLLAFSPHPCELQLILDDERPVVVGIKGNDPLYRKGEKLIRERSVDKYDIGRAKRYAEGHVEITKTGGSQIVGSGSHGGFTVSMVADRTLRNNFIVIIVYNAGFLTNGIWPDALYFVRKLPDLPAGKEVRTEIVTYGSISGSLPGLNPFGERRFFPIIFTEGGLEVKTNKWEEIAAYYLRIKLNMHAAIRARYLQRFPSESHEVAPYYTPAPVLPDNATQPTKQVTAVLDVDKEGYVTDVTINDEIDATAGAAIRDALKEWMFLPRLKDGEPTPIRVQVPVAL